MADVPRLSGPFRGLRLAEDYGVKADGVTDDFAAINRAIAQTPVGGVCRLPVGTMMTSGPIIVPPGKSLEGTHSQTLSYANALAAPAVLKPTSGFSGAAVVRLLDKTLGGYATDAVGTRIRYLMIDGSGGPASVRGVQVSGYVREALFFEVTCRYTTDNGFDVAPDNGRRPMSLRFHHCVSDNANGAGFAIQAADSTLIDCNAQGSGWIGFYLAGAMNGVAIGCRAEWSGAHGFGLMFGDWGSGQGSGGFALVGCITDRNEQNGVYISATGTAPITMTGCQHRRDGRNNKGGGGNFAAVFVDTNATMPVTIDGVTVFPGVDDDGSGTNSPQIGISALGTSPVTVSSGYVHAATTPFALSATNLAAPEIGTATGPTNAPVRVGGTSSSGGGQPTVRDIGNITGTVTPPVIASTGTIRAAMTGDVSIAGISGMYDGQRVLFEFQASGAQRILTFGAAFETTQVVPSRIVTVPAGGWGSALIENRAGTVVLLSATPQLLATADVQAFETAGSFTWTKPAGAKAVQIICIGGGGGGGGGASTASGTACSGGAGGGAGGYATIFIPAALLSATEPITVGAGGAGGTAKTGTSVAGNAGSAGGLSQVGASGALRLRTGNGNGGAGGVIGGAATAGTAGNGQAGSLGVGGGGVNGAAGAQPTFVPMTPSGGGGGGGVSTTPAAFGGAAGGAVNLVTGVTAVAGSAGGGNGGNGGNHLGTYIGGGGGGGGSRISGGAAGSGGAGGNDGAGGGGGGSVVNGQATGAGGAGASGVVVMITYF